MKKEISKDEVMKLLLEACPSYNTKWQEYVRENYETGEEHLLYIDLSDFSSHIIDLFKQDKIDEFPAVFEVIELLHTSGDDYVKEASTIGLLEDIQNQLITNNIDTNAFKAFLERDSLKWWINLNDFWSNKTKYVGGSEK